MRLKDRVCLVTGSSRGIGRSTALTFAIEGADVIVNYQNNKEKADEVVSKIIEMNRKAISVQADVSNKDQVSRMVDEGDREVR